MMPSIKYFWSIGLSEHEEGHKTRQGDLCVPQTLSKRSLKDCQAVVSLPQPNSLTSSWQIRPPCWMKVAFQHNKMTVSTWLTFKNWHQPISEGVKELTRRSKSVVLCLSFGTSLVRWRSWGMNRSIWNCGLFSPIGLPVWVAPVL